MFEEGDVIKVTIDRVSNSGNSIAYVPGHDFMVVDEGEAGDEFHVRVTGTNDIARGERVGLVFDHEVTHFDRDLGAGSKEVDADAQNPHRHESKKSNRLSKREERRRDKNKLLGGNL